jgi:hypothetical protein
MPYCLDRYELEKLIKAEIEMADIEDDKLRELLIRIEHAKNWADELIGFSYFLAKIFEKKLKQGKTIETLKEVLDRTYLLNESMWFEIQEFDEKFVDYVIRFERDPILSLEDDLVQLQNKLSRFEYE